MNALGGIALIVGGVLLLAGLHKLQGYLWRKNYERQGLANPDRLKNSGGGSPEQRPPDKSIP